MAVTNKPLELHMWNLVRRQAINISWEILSEITNMTTVWIFKYPWLGLSKLSYNFRVSCKTSYTFHILVKRSTCSTHPILLDFIILIISGEQKKLRPSLCNIFQIPLRSKFSPVHPVLKHLQSVSFPHCKRSNSTPMLKNI
jgi:hypothetical protein